MLNENKIKLMTEMAMFKETSDGKEAVESLKFFQHDYIARKVIWTEICVTIAYVLSLFIVVAIKLDSIVTDIAAVGILGVAIIVIIVYVVVMILFFIFSRRFYTNKYMKMKKDSVRYFECLQKLNRHYRIEAENEKSEDVYTVE